MSSKFVKQAEKFIVDNSPTIFTGIGVVGTVATAYLTGKASFKAAKIIADREFVVKTHPTTPYSPEKDVLSRSEKFKLVWLCYLPPLGSGVATVGSIVFANRISAKRMAALAAGYTLVEGRFEDYKEKMQEKLGLKKEEAAQTELAQDRVDKNPPAPTMVITSGKSLFKDEPSGRYFESTMEEIKRAQNAINYKILSDEYAVLTDFYMEIGLAPTSLSEEYGWDVRNENEKMEIVFNTVITPDQKPCITMDYNVHPIRFGGKTNGSSAKLRALSQQ